MNITYNINMRSRKAPLPGILCKISKTGYRRDSLDRNNKYNIIPDNNISMKNVGFNVKGVDNLGNTKVMKPGGEYKFPGKYVLETPMKKSSPYKRCWKGYKPNPDGRPAHEKGSCVKK